MESRALHVYRECLAGVVPLDRSAERDLARRWRTGNEVAGAKLVTACLPFVIAIALEYRRWGAPLEDIIQQGNVGLLRAAAKFDLDKECRLTTYAAYWIRAEIRDYVLRTYRVVRLGTTKAERRAVRAYRRSPGSDVQALAAASGMKPERAQWLLPLLASREASLESSVGEYAPLIDRLESPAPSPEDEASVGERRRLTGQAVEAALRQLTDRERLIVRKRLMTDEPCTLQELGARLGVSKERVRQLEERATVKLRARLEEMREEAA